MTRKSHPPVDFYPLAIRLQAKWLDLPALIQKVDCCAVLPCQDEEFRIKTNELLS